jgi:hypothetical protein
MTINVRATSHTRLKARVHYTLGTFIGGKSGAGPSSLHITLEGPTEYVTTRWMKRVYGFLHGIKWIVLLVTWILFQNHLLGVGLIQNRKTMALRMLTTVGLFYLTTCEDPTWIIKIAFGWGHGHTWLHTTLDSPWPHNMILEVCWDGLQTLFFGLSQFHGHGSWVVCKVALRS